MPSLQKRERILDAAERVLRAKGLSGATTREIARETGCADGTLYVHFDDRLTLFVAIVERSLPGFLEPLRQLEHRVGERTVRANLEEVLHCALKFQTQIMPLMASFFAEPELLKGLQTLLNERRQGPQYSIEALESYLKKEQQLGRIPKRVQPHGAAMSLIGGCFYRVFLSQFLGVAVVPSQRIFVRSLVSALDLASAPATRTPKLSTKADRHPATTPGSPVKSENLAATIPLG